MFDIMNADQLITAVRNRPALWDPRNIGHNNRLLVNKLWIEVAEEVCIEKCVAKSKWRGLRDYYRQEMKKQANYINEQGETEYRSSWALYDQMSFVRHTILPRKPRDAVATHPLAHDMDVDNNSEYYEDDPISICIPKLEPQLDIPDFIPEQSRISPSPSEYNDPDKQIRKSSRSSDFKIPELLTKNIDLERKFVQLEQRFLDESENDDLQFFKSLLPDLANLPRAKKSYIRLKIQEIIHKEVHNNAGIVKDDC